MTHSFRVPAWASFLGWTVALGFLGFYFFVVHTCLRALVPAFGLDPGAIGTAVFGTVVMSGFVIWLVSLAELPEMWFIHRRPRRLLARGLCPGCAHQLPPGAPVQCSECGVLPSEIPPPYGMSWNTVRRFLVALSVALLAGITFAELSISIDEERMIRETRTLHLTAPGSSDEWTFERAWPANFGRVDWSCHEGFVPRGLLQAEREARPRSGTRPRGSSRGAG